MTHFDGKEVCDFHSENQELLVSINTKLGSLIWTLRTLVVVFLLPTIIYIFTLDKRITVVESKQEQQKEFSLNQKPLTEVQR